MNPMHVPPNESELERMLSWSKMCSVARFLRDLFRIASVKCLESIKIHIIQSIKFIFIQILYSMCSD